VHATVKTQPREPARALQHGHELGACPEVHPSGAAAGGGDSLMESQADLLACLALSPLMAVALCFHNGLLGDGEEIIGI